MPGGGGEMIEASGMTRGCMGTERACTKLRVQQSLQTLQNGRWFDCLPLRLANQPLGRVLQTCLTHMVHACVLDMVWTHSPDPLKTTCNFTSFITLTEIEEPGHSVPRVPDSN